MNDTPISGQSSIQLPIWLNNDGPESDIITSTRIRLARNLADHRFCYHAKVSERKKIFNQVSSAVKNSKMFSDFDVINFTGLSELDQLFWVEERTASMDLLKVEGDKGVASDFTHRTNIMINEEDHLRIQCMDSGFRPDELWKEINSMDDELGSRLMFAFDPARGFLTCCPTNSGTGLRVSFLMHLPGLVLTKAIDAVLQGASQMGICTRGFFGEHSDVVGNFFQLSNQATMGACEEEFIETTKKTILEVIRHERTARDRILREASLELTDKVYRAYGILLYAQTLSVKECLNLTSALRFGVVSGIFKLVTIEDLNRITLLSMPAHLQKYKGCSMDEPEISVIRADLVRELLKTKRKRKSSRS